MARLVGTSLDSVYISEVERGGPIAAETIRKVWANTALLSDMLTGDNSPPTTINHTGDGRGSLLGGPLVSALLELPFNHTTALSSSVPTYIFLLPLYVPEGEDELEMLVAFTGPLGTPNDFGVVFQVWVYDSTYTNTSSPVGVYELERSDVGVYTARITDHTAGSINYFALVSEGIPANIYAQVILSAVCVYVPRNGTTTRAPTLSRVPTGAPVPLLNTATSGGATTPALVDIDATAVDPDKPLASYVVHQAAKNHNTLVEYAMGGPVGGAYAATLVSSASVSAFADNTKLGKANEPQTTHILAASATGAMRSDYVNLNASWPNGAVARYSVAANAVAVLARVPVFMKQGATRAMSLHIVGADMNAAGGSGTLRCQCFNSAGVSAGLVSTALSLSGKTWRATLSSIPYHSNEANMVEISFTHTKPKSSSNDFAVLGWCLYEVAT